MRPQSLDRPLSLRLGRDQRATLEAEAKRLGIPLQELVRQRLDVTNAVMDPINKMRDELIYALRRGQGAGQAFGAGSTGVVDDALLVELVLSFRQILSPTQRRDVQNSIVELGLDPWTGEGAR